MAYRCEHCEKEYSKEDSDKVFSISGQEGVCPNCLDNLYCYLPNLNGVDDGMWQYVQNTWGHAIPSEFWSEKTWKAVDKFTKAFGSWPMVLDDEYSR